jgi:hypothetical protein
LPKITGKNLHKITGKNLPKITGKKLSKKHLAEMEIHKSIPARRHFDRRQLDRRHVVRRHLGLAQLALGQGDAPQREGLRGRLDLDLAVAELEPPDAPVQACGQFLGLGILGLKRNPLAPLVVVRHDTKNRINAYPAHDTICLIV